MKFLSGQGLSKAKELVFRLCAADVVVQIEHTCNGCPRE